jgi:catechol 2,3-dioxygenase-like lactoylglutathione lyase family enzyme
MTRLHHVALGARDVAAVAAFYRDVLGLIEQRRHFYEDGRLRSVWLELEGALLMVEHTEQALRHVEGVASGPFLLALAATPAERVRLEQALVQGGYHIELRTAYTSYTRDPEGNRVGLSHYPEASS